MLQERGRWKKVSCKSDGGGSESNNCRSCGATSGRNLKPRTQQVNKVDYDSQEEPFAFPINYNGVRACEDNVIAVKINGTMTRMLVDSGAQTTVLGELQFHNLVRNDNKSNMMPEERTLRVYGNECYQWSVNLRLQLNVMGKKEWKLFS